MAASLGGRHSRSRAQGGERRVRPPAPHAAARAAAVVTWRRSRVRPADAVLGACAAVRQLWAWVTAASRYDCWCARRHSRYMAPQSRPGGGVPSRARPRRSVGAGRGWMAGAVPTAPARLAAVARRGRCCPRGRIV